MLCYGRFWNIGISRHERNLLKRTSFQRYPVSGNRCLHIRKELHSQTSYLNIKKLLPLQYFRSLYLKGTQNIKNEQTYQSIKHIIIHDIPLFLNTCHSNFKIPLLETWHCTAWPDLFTISFSWDAPHVYYLNAYFQIHLLIMNISDGFLHMFIVNETTVPISNG
jgi:hypothetical protein